MHIFTASSRIACILVQKIHRTIRNRNGNPMADWTPFGFRMEGFGKPDYPVWIKICIFHYFHVVFCSEIFSYAAEMAIILKDDYNMNEIKQICKEDE